MKRLGKRRRLTRSDAAGSTLPKCQFFDQMAFLHEKSSNKPTECNVQSPEDSLDVVVIESLSSRCVDSPNANKNISTAPQAKRRNKHDATELTLSKTLADCDEMLLKSMTDEKDEDALYCHSLISIMRDLPKRQKRLAKIRISQLLLDLEYEEE